MPLRKILDFFGGGKARPKAAAKQPAVALRVIPRDQHRISRKNISPNALRVLYTLKEGGFQAFLVGDLAMVPGAFARTVGFMAKPVPSPQDA